MTNQLRRKIIFFPLVIIQLAVGPQTYSQVPTLNNCIIETEKLKSYFILPVFGIWIKNTLEGTKKPTPAA